MPRSPRGIATLAALIFVTTASGCSARSTERAAAASAEEAGAPTTKETATPTKETATPPNETATAPTSDEAASSGPALERFVMVGDERGCPDLAHGDCHSEVELRGDGGLRLDPWGAPGSAILEATTSLHDRREAIAALTDPALLALLDADKVCPEANETEQMIVRIGGVERRNRTGYCNQEPIQAARGALIRLTAIYFPDHHLISPPF